MKLKVIDFIKSHKNWEELLKTEPYNLKINEDDNYILLSYDMVNSDFHLPIVNECRGLIIDKNNLSPVALSFKKFYNVQEELAAKIDWKTSKVQEKVDGSKILIWFDKYKDSWRISTSSQLNAYALQIGDFNLSFGDLVEKALCKQNLTKEEFFANLNPNYCYTFELVSPENRVVVPYKFTKLYYIGLRNINTFEEEEKENDIYCFKNFKMPKEYSLKNLNDCLKATQKMGFDEEGFVVVDKNWNRVKIKSPSYVAVHHLRSNINNLGSILSLIENGDIEKTLKIYPEYKEYFDEVNNKLIEFKNELKSYLINFYHWKINNNIVNQKEIAEYILKQPEIYRPFIFTFSKTDLLDLFFKSQWSLLTKNKKLQLLGFKEEVVKDDDYIEE